MIKGYIGVAIVWGNQVKEIALALEACLKDKQKEGYPVAPKICYDSTLGRQRGDLLQKIQSTFEDVKYAFVVLGEEEIALKITAIGETIDALFDGKTTVNRDNVKKMFDSFRTRTTQNVMLECGHFLNNLGLENMGIIVAYDRTSIRFEMPSDFPNAYKEPLHLQSIDGLTHEVIKERLQKTIADCLHNLDVHPHKDYIHDMSYHIDYSKLFSNEELIQIQGRKNIKEQFNAIDELWIQEVESLKRNDEIFVYILERIVFLSYFNIEYQWLDKALAQLNHSLTDDEKAIKRLVLLIKQYITVRNKHTQGKSYNYSEYLDIAEKLLKIKKTDFSGKAINIIARVVLNDYLGLAFRAGWESSPNSERNVQWLIESAVALRDCIHISENDTTSTGVSNLWHGYTYFNLSRTNKYLEENYAKTEYENIIIEKLRNLHIEIGHSSRLFSWRPDLDFACSCRETWAKNLSILGLPTVFEMPLKLEYVYAKIHSFKVLKNASSEEITEFETLFNEIVENYSGAPGLAKTVRRMIKEVRNDLSPTLEKKG